MSSKKFLTEEEIIRIVNNFNFEYVLNSYNNKNKRINVICEKNHETTINFYEFKDVIHKCITCKKTITREKVTIESLRDEFNNLNFNLLSETYDGCYGTLEFICDKGHKEKISDRTWKKKKRCPTCAKEKGNNGMKLSYEFVKKCFDENGFELLSTEYVNKNGQLLFKCPKGHTKSITFNKFRYENNRCGDCSVTKKLTYEQVKKMFNEYNYTLLSTKYENSTSKLDFKCPNGHINKINYSDFRAGNRCIDCSKVRRSTFEEVREVFESNNCVLLSNKYTKSKDKLNYICPVGHVGKITYDSFSRGTRCGICMESKGEVAIRKHLQKIKLEFVPEMKFKQCKSERCLPFDFYVNNQFIIEFDGEQHFKSVDFYGGEKKFKKRQLHDKIKTDFCFDYHIPLLRISYDCIKDIPNIIDNFIKYITKSKDSTAITFSNPLLYDHLEYN